MSVSRVLGLLARLTGAVLGLGALAAGCGPSDRVGSSAAEDDLGEISSALLDEGVQLEDVDGDGDVDSDDVDELLLDLQAAEHVAPGEAESCPDEGQDPSPQPWHEDVDPEAGEDSAAH